MVGGGRRRVVIMGAAGRDFHNFNTRYRGDEGYEVLAFTATQIPGIEGRRYPPILSGPLYPDGIPILPEEDLPRLIREEMAEEVVFAYSDVAHLEVMHKASMVLALGADFTLLGPASTMLQSKVPVISVGAVRTGAGKSQTTRRISAILKEDGFRVVVVRHPMPYGDLSKQVSQRFASYEDFDRYNCTIEEREEYEAHIDMGTVVYAGVDYGKILEEAEREAEVIVWDGGNNDFPFYKPNLHIVVIDPLRPGHETLYHPGETNLRMADVVVVNKVDTARTEDVRAVEATIGLLNPGAKIIRGISEIRVDGSESLKGKKVLVVEDGPTLTHGGMAYGAGTIAAERMGASEIVDPRPYLEGSLRRVFEQYPHLGKVLPAIGYWKGQIKELERVINAVPCDLVVVGTPVDLRRVLNLNKPAVRVSYSLRELGDLTLRDVLVEFAKGVRRTY